jgi:hypothetical protein
LALPGCDDAERLHVGDPTADSGAMTTRRPAIRGRHRVITPLSVVVSVLIGLVALSYGLPGPIRDMIVNLTSLMLAVAAVLAALHACRRATGHCCAGACSVRASC